MNRSPLSIALGMALGAVLGAACNDTTNIASGLLNLDRPVDIAFACYGRMRVTHGNPATGTEDLTTTAQPTSSCETRSLPTGGGLEIRPPGQEDLPNQQVGTADWYGLILESAPGTVALARWNSQPATAFAGSFGTEVQVLDAAPLTPGKNAISVGEEPIAIETDTTGCYAVTANAGTCDLSVLDINSALAGLSVSSTLGTLNPGQAGAVRVDRIPVKNRNGVAINARPAAMVGEPSTDTIGNECKTVPVDVTKDPTRPSGVALAPQGIAYIAYPTCHLVAAVDMTSGIAGTIVAAIQYGASGPTLLAPADVAAVSCPAECGPPSGTRTDGGRPVTLAYRQDTLTGAVPETTRRLAIGADNSSLLTIVELGDDSLPTSLSTIKLEDATEKPGTPGSGKLGVTAIALSARIGMGGSAGTLTPDERATSGGLGQYIYAVANDHSVRVADVLTLGKECDTQVDTRFLRDNVDDNTRFRSLSIPAMQCFVVGGPQTPPRSPGAIGPGIVLPGNGVPLSVAFVKSPGVPGTAPNGNPNVDSRTTPAPVTLLGTFAIVTATSGQAFVVNVDDDLTKPETPKSTDPQGTAPVLVMAHQLRDAISNRDLGVTVPGATTNDPPVKSCKAQTAQGNNGPHASSPPLSFATGGPLALSKLGELPSIRQVNCQTDPVMNPAGDSPPPGIAVPEVMLAADPEVRDQVFPDLRNLAPGENWTLTWEGALSQDGSNVAIDGPPIREAQMFTDSTVSGRIEDSTHPFCSMGVEPFDILQVRGCDPAKKGFDCPSGYTCFVHPDRSVSIGSVTIGTCMQADEAPRLASACRDYMISLRRYTISDADSGELVLRPRQHELRTTPLDGCTSDAQCTVLADYAASNAVDSVAVSAVTNDTLWECRADDTRKPINADPAQNKRCVQRCAFHGKQPDGMDDGKDRDADCDPGTICQGATPDAGDGVDHRGFCMEGVMPPQACVNAPLRYEVRSSEAFTVIGTSSGYVHPFIENPDKSDPLKANACVIDSSLAPSQREVQIGRFPLSAPACDPMANPLTGELPTHGQFEPNPCSLMANPFESLATFTPISGCSVPTLMFGNRTAPAIKFRNRGMTLTVVDPYYPGDQTCPFDRLGNPAIAGQRIPLVFPGFQISFTQTSGYTPLSLSLVSSTFSPAFPVKVIEGPTNSIWVLDNGDFLSATLGVPSTRGQVFRIESVNLGAVNLLQ